MILSILINLVIVFYSISIHCLQYFIFSLAKRAGKLETVINSIVTKIDAVLMKLEKLDVSKNKRKATVNKILGTIKEGDNGKYEYFLMILTMIEEYSFTKISLQQTTLNCTHLFS